MNQKGNPQRHYVKTIGLGLAIAPIKDGRRPLKLYTGFYKIITVIAN